MAPKNASKNNDLVAVANNRKLRQKFTPAVPRTFDQDCSYTTNSQQFRVYPQVLYYS